MHSEIEILNGRIAAATETNSEVVDAMNNLAALQLETDISAAIKTAERSIDAARSIQYPKGEATGLMHAGMAASKQRTYDKARQFYQQSLYLLQQQNDQDGIAAVQGRLGNVCLYEGKYEDALSFYGSALDIRMMQGNAMGCADLYTNSGIVYGLMGNNSMALKSHIKALKTFEQLNEQARIATSSSNIGVIYIDLQNYDEALKMFERGLAIRRLANDERAISTQLNNIGFVLQEQKKYKESLEYHKQALVLRERIGDKTQLATTYSNLGNVYKALGDNAVALQYYNLCLSIFEELKDKRGLVQSYINLGELYFELNNDNNNAKAYQYLSGAIKLAEEIGLKNRLRNACLLMSQLYARNGAFEDAYNSHVRFTELDKDISSAEINGQMAQLTLRHEIEQKERDAELERIKNIELTKAYNSLDEEKKRSEELLLNILPAEISAELKLFGKTKARSFEMATVLFADIKGFTHLSEQLSAEELVTSIDEYFEAFDKIVEKHCIEKIKTIGDAYLCAGGLPVAETGHAEKVVRVALEFVTAAETLRQQRIAQNLPAFDFRIGIHSGPLVAGVVGIKKFAYDIWGDTVNIASRMQQTSEPHRINISESTYQLVKGSFECEYRGEIEAKNKGLLKMYFVK